MAYEAYTDEKRPDGHVVIYDIEADVPQQKPKRPLWRRIVRIFLAVGLFSLLYNAFTEHTCTHRLSNDNDMVRHPHHRPTHGGPPKHDKPKMDYSWGDLDDFKIEQGTLNPVPSKTDIFGKILVGSDANAKGISAKFDIHVSDDRLWDDIKIEPSKHGLYFAADKLSFVKQYINITLHVTVPARDDYSLKTFQVDARELNIRLLDSFTTKVNGTYFGTTTGNITSYGGLKDVEMSPYVTAKTVSGNIYGRFGLGKSLVLKTVSGNIGVNVTDAPLDGVDAKLVTETVSGENRVQFADVLHDRKLVSKHVAVAGNVIVDYPVQWQGHMKATSVTGKIHFTGEGVQIIKKKNGVTERLLKALKGDGPCHAFLHSTGGDISLAFPGADAKDPQPGDGDGVPFSTNF